MFYRVFLVFVVVPTALAMPMTRAQAGVSLLRVTEQGAVRGIQWDANTLAWLGLPYARPPEGQLRWKAPQSPKPFFGVYKGDRFGSECTQIGGLLLDLKAETFGKTVGDEDCLYLNVWRPRTKAQNLPVFVWIHGGMNSVGEGATSLYHGANLAHEANAVVVTINYRLGLFGWFAHEALQSGNPVDDSGNFGLLDIIAALKWLQKNIDSFGGDPNKVTLAGESGGAYNVISLLASPLANGLFHRAIASSPTTSLMALPMKEARKKADEFFKKVVISKGMASTKSEAAELIRVRGPSWVKKTLMSLTKEEILLYSTRISGLGLNEVGLLSDVLGASRFEDGTVLEKEYKSAIKKGKSNRVPLIVGSNTEEFKIFQIAFGIISELDEYQVLDLIQNFDPNDDVPTVTDILPWMKVPQYHVMGKRLSVLFETTGVDPLARHHSKYSDVFVYKFSWKEQPAPFDFLVGASHMMELPFMFGNFQTDKDSMFRFAWSEQNREKVQKMSQTIIGFLTNFMWTGDPGRGPAVVPEWKPWSTWSIGAKRLYWNYDFKMGN